MALINGTALNGLGGFRKDVNISWAWLVCMCFICSLYSVWSELEQGLSSLLLLFGLSTLSPHTTYLILALVKRIKKKKTGQSQNVMINSCSYSFWT